jgi:hypothetical protein
MRISIEALLLRRLGAALGLTRGNAVAGGELPSWRVGAALSRQLNP